MQNPAEKAGYRHRHAQPIAPVENIKEIQQKLKEEKEAKRAQLDGRHDYVLGIVAACLDLEKAEIEDAVLEGNQIERIDRFFAVGGLRHVIFYYQDLETSDAGHMGPPGGNTNVHTKRSKKTKVFVTEGRDVALTGVCIFFIRSNSTKLITTENVHKEVNFNMLDIAQGGLLKSVENLLYEIYIPALKTMDHGWGDASGPQRSANIRQDFLNSLEGFVSVLSGAQQSLEEKVNLEKCTTIDLKSLKGPTDYIAVVNSTEALERIETCMKVWIKQIEQILAASNQLRKEADDLGPRAELDHWKKRLSKFNYLLDQLKNPDVKAVIGVLTAAKSKFLKIWRQLDTHITDSANEAKDNVKYLYTLEKFCDPLYSYDPFLARGQASMLVLCATPVP